MRVLHTSDWHLGRSFHGYDILDHQRALIDWIVSTAVDYEVDLVVVAGDVYDRAVPSLAAVAVWENAVTRLTRHCPVLVTSGNHDSPTRLGFAGSLLAGAGLHLRTSVDALDDPLIVEGRDGVILAAYGVPYLEPDLHRETLGAERSHASVIGAAMDRIRADVAARQDARSLVVAHAFITGGGSVTVSDSERDLRIGGIGDAPAAVFAGVDHVALGHLHGAQEVRTAEALPSVHYSGSPLAFSFSEEAQLKSVTLIDVPAHGPTTVERIVAPVPRQLTTITGTLDDLLDDPATASYADHWVRVVLTDERRPDDPMGRIRHLLPHVVELRFESARSLPNRQDGESAEVAAADPLSLAEGFVEHVTATPPEPDEVALLRDAVERVRIAQVSA